MAESCCTQSETTSDEIITVNIGSKYQLARPKYFILPCYCQPSGIHNIPEHTSFGFSKVHRSLILSSSLMFHFGPIQLVFILKLLRHTIRVGNWPLLPSLPWSFEPYKKDKQGGYIFRNADSINLLGEGQFQYTLRFNGCFFCFVIPYT